MPPLLEPEVRNLPKYENLGRAKICTKDKSAASFCRLLSAQFESTFCNFYVAKNHKIAHVSTTTEAKEKISADFEFLEFYFLCLQILKQLNAT